MSSLNHFQFELKMMTLLRTPCDLTCVFIISWSRDLHCLCFLHVCVSYQRGAGGGEGQRHLAGCGQFRTWHLGGRSLCRSLRLRGRGQLLSQELRRLRLRLQRRLRCSILLGCWVGRVNTASSCYSSPFNHFIFLLIIIFINWRNNLLVTAAPR